MEIKYDYLKYWKVIRYYYTRKYDLSTSDLDMLFFLYSEKYFNRSKFIEYDAVLVWDRNRMKRLLEKEWIEIFRPKLKDRKAVYQLSYKAKRVITHIYKKLNGDPLCVEAQRNPMFAVKASFADKVHRNVIREMNRQIKENKIIDVPDMDL